MRTTRTTALVTGAAGLALLAGGAATASSWAPLENRTVSQVATAVTGEGAPGVLAFNREEERMARDLYTLFADTYDAGPFANIARSEQQHFDAVGRLLTTNGIDDPSVGRKAGDYADPQIQRLYDEGKAQGLTSLEAAYQVGIDLENRDIEDLEASIAEVTQDGVTTVLSHLLTASRMHLRVFTAAADGSYVGSMRGGTGYGMGERHGNGMVGGRGGGMGFGRGGSAQDDDSTRSRGFGPGDGTGVCPMSS